MSPWWFVAFGLAAIAHGAWTYDREPGWSILAMAGGLAVAVAAVLTNPDLFTN